METPALAELMAGYFHQDWDLDGTEAEVIALFISHHPDLGPRLPREIDAVMREGHTEAELRALLREMGCQRLPDPSVDGYHAWLQSIARQAQDQFDKAG